MFEKYKLHDANLKIFSFFLMIKFSLDFLSSARELNSMLLLVLSVLLFFIFTRSYDAERLVINSISLVMLPVIFWGLLGEIQFGSKFFIISIVAGVVYLGCDKMKLSDYQGLARVLLKFALCSLLVNIAISFQFASPLSREFFNFEHANLLGSYVLSFSALLCFLQYNSIFYRVSRVLIVCACFFTTSTGAFLLSLLLYIDGSKLSKKDFIMLAVLLILGLVTVFYLTSFLDETLHYKIFLPLYMLFNGDMLYIKDMAAQGIPLQELEADKSSSLLWRIYATFIFISHIANSDILNLIFGNGFSGYSTIWDGIMPHNDFLLILIDMGIIGFGVVVFLFYKFFSYGYRHSFPVFILTIMLFFRLLLENNIYSFYVFSNIVIFSVMLYKFELAKRRMSKLKND